MSRTALERDETLIKRANIRIVSVGEEQSSPVNFYVENGEYVIDENLKTQTSYLLIFE